MTKTAVTVVVYMNDSFRKDDIETILWHALDPVLHEDESYQIVSVEELEECS